MRARSTAERCVAGLALALAVAGALAAAPGDGAPSSSMASPPANACAHLQVDARRSDGHGEFEGRYRVGRTSCSVVPGRMVYALTWARGHRPMDFFYEGESPAGEPVFVSEPRDEGVDRFYFADRAHDRGVFVRADGLCLPVRRAAEPTSR